MADSTHAVLTGGRRGDPATVAGAPGRLPATRPFAAVACAFTLSSSPSPGGAAPGYARSWTPHRVGDLRVLVAPRPGTAGDGSPAR